MDRIQNFWNDGEPEIILLLFTKMHINKKLLKIKSNIKFITLRQFISHLLLQCPSGRLTF